MCALLEQAIDSGNSEVAMFLGGYALKELENSALFLSAYEIATSLGRKDAIENLKLVDTENTANDLSQDAFINKVKVYLICTNRLYPTKFSMLLDDDGYCSGLTEIWQLKRLHGQESQFFEVYERICSWDQEDVDDVDLDIEKLFAQIRFTQDSIGITNVGEIQQDYPAHEKILVSAKDTKLSEQFIIIQLEEYNPDILQLMSALSQLTDKIPTNSPCQIAVYSLTSEYFGHAIGVTYDGSSYHLWDTNDMKGKKICSSLEKAAAYLYQQIIKTLKTINRGRNSDGTVPTYAVAFYQFLEKSFVDDPQNNPEKIKQEIMAQLELPPLRLGLDLITDQSMAADELAQIIKNKPQYLGVYNNSGRTGLMDLLDHKNAPLVLRALTQQFPDFLQHADINIKECNTGMTALYRAISNKLGVDIIKQLMIYGASISIANQRVPIPHTSKIAPSLDLLELAIKNNDIPSANLLIAYGHELAPIHLKFAIANQNQAVVDTLLAVGCPHIQHDFTTAGLVAQSYLPDHYAHYSESTQAKNYAAYRECVTQFDAIDDLIRKEESLIGDPNSPEFAILAEAKNWLAELRQEFSENLTDPLAVMGKLAVFTEQGIDQEDFNNRNDMGHPTN